MTDLFYPSIIISYYGEEIEIYKNVVTCSKSYLEHDYIIQGSPCFYGVWEVPGSAVYKNAGGVIQSKTEGPRTSVCVGVQGHQCKSWSLKAQNQTLLCPKGGEDGCPAQEERARICHFSPSALCSSLVPGRVGRWLPTLMRAYLLYSVYWFKCKSLPEIPSQTHQNPCYASHLGIP